MYPSEYSPNALGEARLRVQPYCTTEANILGAAAPPSDQPPILGRGATGLGGTPRQNWVPFTLLNAVLMPLEDRAFEYSSTALLKPIF